MRYGGGWGGVTKRKYEPLRNAISADGIQNEPLGKTKLYKTNPQDRLVGQSAALAAISRAQAKTQLATQDRLDKLLIPPGRSCIFVRTRRLSSILGGSETRLTGFCGHTSGVPAVERRVFDP